MSLQLLEVTRRYGDHAVLDRFSLQLPDCGVIALMGPSGCGKTTLLRLIAGLEKPDDGEVLFSSNTKISMIFQEERLIDVLTVRENVLSVLDATQFDRADHWLSKCGLLESANLFPSEISGGMKRRLAIARAMAYGGNLVLLDEPFGGLDAETKEQVRRSVFENPEAKNRLHLMVTHDMTDATAVADRLLMLRGTPLEVAEDRYLR